jgi:alpha-beta hydrolase superfamily lysophospholipase
MREAIGNRELIQLDGLGVRLQGTYHLPADRSQVKLVGRTGLNRVGVVFVNSLSLPRAASGDSAVHWADSIAQHGYPAFRIDLPGLGDSEGFASTGLLNSINAGDFAPAAAAAVKQLVDRFDLSGVIIFGHCAGAVSALYAGAASAHCKGLILLDPYFHLPLAERPKVRQQLSNWARSSKIGTQASNIYDQVRDLRLSLRGNMPPANANSPLLAKWKQLASAGLPILLLQAPGIKSQGRKPRVGQFDYMEHAMKLAGRKNRVSVEFVGSADHSFANREGRAAVEQHMKDWLLTNFRLPEFEFNTVPLSLMHTGENQNDGGGSHGHFIKFHENA